MSKLKIFKQNFLIKPAEKPLKAFSKLKTLFEALSLKEFIEQNWFGLLKLPNLKCQKIECQLQSFLLKNKILKKIKLSLKLIACYERSDNLSYLHQYASIKQILNFKQGLKLRSFSIIKKPINSCAS